MAISFDQRQLDFADAMKTVAFFLLTLNRIQFKGASAMSNMTMNNLSFASIALALILSTTNQSFSQTIEITTEGHSGHAVVTENGTITAKHVGGIDFDYSCEEMDIVIDTKSTSDTGIKTSDLPPDHFIDRRGRKHSLYSIGNLDYQTVVSMRFFVGESGMPIFAADGSVTCIVLGNVFIKGRWYGRIARVTPIVEFSLQRRRLIRRR